MHEQNREVVIECEAQRPQAGMVVMPGATPSGMRVGALTDDP